MNSLPIESKFIELFGQTPRIFRSPGRINLIGEHTDYNEGFVLPAAIDKEIMAALAINGSDSICHLYAMDLDLSFEFDLNQFEPCTEGWPNYIMGVADQILKNDSKLKGFDCVIGGDVPLGAGLSSSAALECVIGYGLNELFTLGFSKLKIVKIAQKAEHNFAGVMCGIMDQFASMMGKKDAVFRLDCRSLDYDYFPLELGDYQILLINSNVKHSLASTEYNTRRMECEEGIRILKTQFPEINNLRDVNLEMLKRMGEQIPPVTYKRCRFVIEENKRVLDSCEALQGGDIEKFGQLVYGSHMGLSNDYEVSCPELDFLVEQTRDKYYILGARMMGGGFGGCTLNIIRKDKIKTLIDTITPLYKAAFGKEITPIEVAIENRTSAII